MRTSISVSLVLMWLATACGCSSDDPDAADVQNAGARAEQPEAEPEPTPISPAVERDAEWTELAVQARKHLQQEEFEAARQPIDALATLAESDPLPSSEQLEELRQLREELQQQMAVVTTAEREARLSEIPSLIENGRLDEAVAALDFAASRVPTDEEREQITEYRTRIEEIRAAQRKLGAWMKLLASESRSDVRAAQAELVAEPEAALPLLLASLEAPGDAALVRNSLEALRLLRRPAATLPAMVDVLRRAEQKESWEHAAKAIVRSTAHGAGPGLLELACASDDPEQRGVALSALSQVPDPPRETLLALLPLIYSDGPELAAVLQCTTHSVRVNRQGDLLGHRGLGRPVTPEEIRRLSALPDRLRTLMEAAPDEAGETGRSARILAIETHQVTPQPLTGVSVFNVSAEYPEGPGGAMLDGVWNSTDLATMWYHPIAEESVVVLDLGEERTVTGVKFWNFNQPGGQTRGWKQAEVYVSSTPTALSPAATGFVPRAPGAAETSDYGVVIPVPAVRGRYVKLKASEIWNPSSYTGLAEVQVLGF